MGEGGTASGVGGTKSRMRSRRRRRGATGESRIRSVRFTCAQGQCSCHHIFVIQTNCLYVRTFTVAARKDNALIITKNKFFAIGF